MRYGLSIAPWIAVTFLTMDCFNSLSALELQVGKPFPNLRLPSLKDGSPMSIQDFRGQKVVLHVFASW